MHVEIMGVILLNTDKK